MEKIEEASMNKSERKGEVSARQIERGVQEALHEALSRIRASGMAKQVIQLVINYLIAELQAFSSTLDD